VGAREDPAAVRAASCVARAGRPPSGTRAATSSPYVMRRGAGAWQVVQEIWCFRANAGTACASAVRPRTTTPPANPAAHRVTPFALIARPLRER
jgi:hypothetical protein